MAEDKTSDVPSSTEHGIGLCVDTTTPVMNETKAKPIDKKILEENIKKAEALLKKIEKKPKVHKQRTLAHLKISKNRNMLKLEEMRVKNMDRASGATSRRLAVLKKRVQMAEKAIKKSNPDAKRYVSAKFKDLNDECKSMVTKK